MTAEEIIGLTLTLLVMLVGFIGSVVPLLPGPPLVLIAALLHRLWFGQHSASVPVLLYLGALTVAALLLDHFASVYGAKRFGATWRGLLGAFVGGVIGIFFNIPGIIIGPFLGAMLFEMLGGYKIDKASHAGVGATLGVFAGVIGKCVVSVIMIGMFTISVIWRS
jgi:uncharacterized protein